MNQFHNREVLRGSKRIGWDWHGEKNDDWRELKKGLVKGRIGEAADDSKGFNDQLFMDYLQIWQLQNFHIWPSNVKWLTCPIRGDWWEWVQVALGLSLFRAPMGSRMENKFHPVFIIFVYCLKTHCPAIIWFISGWISEHTKKMDCCWCSEIHPEIIVEQQVSRHETEIIKTGRNLFPIFEPIGAQKRDKPIATRTHSHQSPLTD